MGNLLVAPITDKETHKGVSEDGIEFGVSSMQGWRVHMEDAHICETVLFAEQLKNEPQISQENSNNDREDELIESSSNDESANSSKRAKTGGDIQTDGAVSIQEYTQIELKGHSLFAVFDGHGGTFAAEYAALNFKRVFSRQPAIVQYARFLEEAAGKEDNHDENIISPHAKAQFNRQGLDLLETALKDAFLDIDREIWRWINGKTCGPDCILPSKKQDDEDEHLDDDGKSGEDSDSDAELDAEEHRRILDSEEEIWRSQQDAGTTATVVILTPTLILCANAGDSRAVCSRNGHCTIPLSYDHKPDDEAEERRIYEAGGFVRGSRVEGDLALSRGLGDFRFKEDAIYEAMDMDPVSFSNYGNGNGRKRKGGATGNVDSPQDQKVSPLPDIIVQNRNPDLDEFIVIACDGIFDVQTNHECISMTAEIFQDGEKDLGLVCEEILDICLEKGSKDNMTALVLKFPAMVIGEGGGVEERRRRRKEKEDESEEDSPDNQTN
jgi:serine/threonine protein phosphatase PrpC